MQWSADRHPPAGREGNSLRLNQGDLETTRVHVIGNRKELLTRSCRVYQVTLVYRCRWIMASTGKELEALGRESKNPVLENFPPKATFG